MARPRNWRPKGKGFYTYFDRGSSACWLRRNSDKTITCVVYLNWGNCSEHCDGIWTLECRPNASVFYQVYDKPHRVAWVAGLNKDDDWLGVISYTRQPVPQGVRRRPKIRGYTKYRRERPMSKHPKLYRQRSWWLVPRKFR